MRLRQGLLLLFCLFLNKLLAQCPEIATTTVIPNCIPDCELCVNDIFTVNLTGFDLPNGGRVEYYLSPTPGFNPYQGQGALIGSVGITTPGGNCRICPELMGFLIDACGTEQNNEFIIMWTGSGFNTSNFVFDFAPGNNTGGGQNADIGGGCSVTAGGASSVGGCASTQVGAGFALPANAVWVIFTSSAVNYSYDFSSVCALGLKLFVSKSSCARSIGAFTNGGGTGTRTQGFSINGCGCATSVSYDLNDPNMMGDGDAWAGGVTNGGCAATISGAGNYIPATSTIAPFKFKIPDTWCDKTFEIVGIVNPKPDPMCCKEIFTERFTITVKCPVANKASLENCDDGTGRGRFILEDAESTILGNNSGTVEWFLDAAGNTRISSPFNSKTTIVYARIKVGNCLSPLVPVELKVTPFTAARGTTEERCAELDGLATFPLLNLENYIRNGNTGAQVKFYEDISKSAPILPPFRTGTIIIYATTCKGDCESLPVEIRLIVNPLPIAKDIIRIACPEVDGKATFNLNLFIPFIKDSVVNNTVVIYRDSTLKDTILSPFRTDSSILIAVVSNGKCIGKSKIFLKTGVLKFNQILLDQACQDINGEAVFTLIEITKQIQSGDTNIKVNYYTDSTLLNPLNPPIKLISSGIIYAVYKKDGCTSLFFPIQLNVVNKPLANSLEVKKCSKLDGTFDFNLDSISVLINNNPGIKIEIYTDSTLTNKVKGTFTTDSDTLFAISVLGSCNSETSMVILQAIKTPIFAIPRDTTGCSVFILDSIRGKYHTSNASYYSNRNGMGSRFNFKDSIRNTRYIYRYDNNNGCYSQDSFKINIVNPSNAGLDQITSVCEGTQVDLSIYTTKADTGGVYTELIPSGRLNKKIYNTTGLSGQSITIKYIVPSTYPCSGDTADIQLQIVKKLSAGLDTTITLCSLDSIDLNDLLRLADPGGKYFDQGGKSITSKIIGTKFGFGLYAFTYTIGDGINCLKSDAKLSILFRQSTLIDYINDTIVCNHFILEPITGLNTFQRSSYFSMPNRTGKMYKAGDTIFINTTLYASGTDLNYCTNEVKFNIQVVSQNSIDIQTGKHCPDYVLIVAGTRFDINNPAGTATAKARNSSECDTTYTVKLSFANPSIYTLNSTLCSGEFIVVNGTRFDESNPTGKEILRGASSLLCDSSVFINLNFYPIADTLIEPQICKGDSLLINGTLYHEANSRGQTILQNQFGCDSTVYVQAKILFTSTTDFRSPLCAEDSMVINGNVYNASRLTGQEIFQNRQGCDSIVNIALSLYPQASFIYRNTLCPEAQLTIGSTVFNKLNPIFTTTLSNGSINGCDSMVDIQLFFYPESLSNYNRTICPGESVTINNSRYDQFKPNGVEILKNSNSHGCDSVVQIDLQVIQNKLGTYSSILCEGDSLYIGNQYFYKDRTRGTDTIIAGSSAGCDSITQITIQLLKPNTYYLKETLCPDEKIIINGKTYDTNHRSGQETLNASSSNGCDSIILINLDFASPELIVQQEYTIQSGNEIVIKVIPNFIPTSISWSPSSGLSCTDCLNPIANPEEDTEYTLTLIDENGCTIVRRIKVLVNKDIQIYIPNVFSPNGDLTNDQLVIVSNNNDLLIEKFLIFDRWGEMVFSIEQLKLHEFQGWNGEFKGERLNPGVYVYYLQVQSKNGDQKSIQGDITLLR